MPIRTSPHRLRAVAFAPLWDIVVRVGLFITLLCAYVPFDPTMPSAGLDSSWMVGMNEAVARGLVIGQSVVFTFGPYAALYSRLFHPALDHQVLLAGVLIAVACYLCILRATQAGKPSHLVMLVLWLLCFSYSIDALLIGAALLTALFAWKIAFDRATVTSEARLRFEVAVVFAALGLLSLVKATLLVLAGPVLLLSMTAFVLGRRRRLALLALCASVFGTLFFWGLSGQPVAAVPSYVRASMSIISGYTDAMSVTGNAWEVVAYWLVATLSLIGILRDASIAFVSRLVLAAMFGLFLLTASKSGFVRHDFHATIAAATLVFAMLLLQSMLETKWSRLTLVLALCVGFYFDRNYVHTSTSGFLARASRLYSSVGNGWDQRRSPGDGLRTRFESSMRALDSTGAIPRVSGSSDIYSTDQSHLIATGDGWSPRPVFQSYSVYTPRLAEMNRRHLAAADAPDHLFVRIEPIDAHLPLMEDGPSWVELLTRYRPVALTGDLLSLDRLPSPRSLVPAQEREVDGTLGVPTAVLRSSPITAVRIDVHPTLIGRLANLLLKSVSLQVVVQSEDNAVHTYRLVAGMARAGFVVSPLIESVGEAVFLYSPRGTLDRKQVRSMTVQLPPDANWLEKWFWRSEYQIRYRSIDLDGSVDLSSVLQVRSAAENVSADNESIVDCLGSIDLINDARDLTRLSADSILKVDGWMDQGSAALPERKVFIFLSDRDRHRQYFPTRATQRPDVAAYLKRPELTDAGYTTTIDVAKMDVGVTVGLAFESAGTLHRCRQFAIPVSLKRGGP